jgi:TonB family protein
MRLLDKLDKVIGPGVLDKPIFPELSDKDEAVAKTHRLLSLKEVEAGDYDLLFQGAPDTASELFRASQITAVKPSIRLVSSTPCAPKEFVNPNYPPIAKLARVEGKVEVHLKVANDGTVTHFEFKAGHPILRIATEEAVSKWTFPAEAAGQEIEVVLEFNTNCPKDTK